MLTRRSLVICLVALAGCGGPGEAQWSDPPAPKIDDPSLIPVPIGATQAYQPRAGAPTDDCEPGDVQGRYRAHVELFAHKQAIVIPQGIGLRNPKTNDLDRVESAQCRAPIRTLDPTGVIHFDKTDLTLRDLFTTWGQPFTGEALLSFTGETRVYVAGKPAAGNPRLTDEAQIVVELGGYIPPHPSFTFPPRS